MTNSTLPLQYSLSYTITISLSLPAGHHHSENQIRDRVGESIRAGLESITNSLSSSLPAARNISARSSLSSLESDPGLCSKQRGEDKEKVR